MARVKRAEFVTATDCQVNHSLEVMIATQFFASTIAATLSEAMVKLTGANVS
jgi:hypothetical protein